jgi:uncharacterized protein
MEIFLTFIYYSFYLLFPLLIIIIWQLGKNSKKSIELIFILIFILFFIWMRFVEPELVVVKKYNFNKNTDLGRELKVVVFSDIHLGVYSNKSLLEKVVNRIEKIEPDIVLIPGDFLYFSNRETISDDFSLLKNISAPTFAVLGNHDYGKKDNNVSRDLNSALESLGILMIDNKSKKITINNGYNKSMVEFIGVEDFLVGNPNYSILEKDDLYTKADFTFLLTHNPDTAHDVKDLSGEKYKEIDLLIAGHTHAGQIRIPLLYKHIIPTKYNFDKGFYNISGLDVFVTPGIGTVGLPLRFLAFPEISVLNIKY